MSGRSEMSSTQVDADTIKRLAKTTIDGIVEDRKKRKNEFIQKWIGRRNWVRRHFWMKLWTAEEAVKCLEAYDWPYANIDFLGITMSHGEQEHVARKLLALAENSADGLVRVTAKDFDLIS